MWFCQLQHGLFRGNDPNIIQHVIPAKAGIQEIQNSINVYLRIRDLIFFPVTKISRNSYQPDDIADSA